MEADLVNSYVCIGAASDEVTQYLEPLREPAWQCEASVQVSNFESAYPPCQCNLLLPLGCTVLSIAAWQITVELQFMKLGELRQDTEANKEVRVAVRDEHMSQTVRYVDLTVRARTVVVQVIVFTMSVMVKVSGQYWEQVIFVPWLFGCKPIGIDGVVTNKIVCPPPMCYVCPPPM